MTTLLTPDTQGRDQSMSELLVVRPPRNFGCFFTTNSLMSKNFLLFNLRFGEPVKNYIML